MGRGLKRKIYQLWMGFNKQQPARQPQLLLLITERVGFEVCVECVYRELDIIRTIRRGPGLLRERGSPWELSVLTYRVRSNVCLNVRREGRWDCSIVA